MLKIVVRDGESIERALKRYKRKYKQVKQMQQIRENREYKKKSEQRRETLKKAIYRNKYIQEHSNE